MPHRQSRAAGLALAVLFVVGAHLLPLLHFALCPHGWDSYHETTVHVDSCTSNDEAPASPLGDPPGKEECPVFHLIHQASDSHEFASIGAVLLDRQGAVELLVAQAFVKAQHLYFLAPSHSPPLNS